MFLQIQYFMISIELKFLFEGVIFSAPVHFLASQESKSRLQFIVTFATKYLINRYAKGYTLTLENNSFNPIPLCDKKEGELLKSLQEAIINHPEIAPAIA